MVEVFVHDPIYAWSCLSPKNVQREAGEGIVGKAWKDLAGRFK